MDFDDYIARAWDAHADDPAGVADRAASDGAAQVATEAQWVALAHLIHHLDGEHLGRWHAGRDRLRALTAHPAWRDDGASGAAWRRCDASLQLAAGDGDDPRPALPPDERIRVAAMAAAQLVGRDTPRAARLFDDALRAIDAAGDGSDPADRPLHRAVAVAANNLACTLEERPGRSDAERDLMIVAATAARRHWALAGTWLEMERAEYRLAMTWLQAGDARRAVEHARRCLAIVAEHGDLPLERLFGGEALALALDASGDRDATQAAVGDAATAFDALDGSDRGWCRPTLDRLLAIGRDRHPPPAAGAAR